MKITKIRVKLPYIDQQIFIGNDFLDFSCRKIMSMHYDKLIVVADANLYKSVKQSLKNHFGRKIAKTIIVRPTIRFKEFSRCSEIIEKMVDAKMNRNCCLIAIGGGYVGDLAGFIAANYMRGIDFVQIPTTVMSMSDAIVGKVAINFNGIKNLLGSFYSPRFTFCDTSLLKTLDSKEMILGLVEIWKHALIANNAAITKKLIKCLNGRCNQNLYSDLIAFSLKVKKKHVQDDYNDRNGLHKALSLGHTFANYLEQTMKLRHGQAVFYGIILEAILSRDFKTISKKKFNSLKPTIKSFEKSIGLLHKIQDRLSVDDVISSLRFDKINQGSLFTFVLLTNKGYCVKSNITNENLRSALTDFKRFRIL